MLRNRLSTNNNSFEGEDINPMEGVANMSDAMLVLAVGVMMALIVAWNVDIGTSSSSKDNAVKVEEGDSLTNSEDGKSTDDYGLTEAGTLYKDADGNYYMVEQ